MKIRTHQLRSIRESPLLAGYLLFHFGKERIEILVSRILFFADSCL